MTTETVNVTVTANGNGNAAKTATTMTTTTTVNGNANAAAAGGKNTETQKKNRIQVSNTKKPLFFYVNLAKRYIQQHNEVELSALGMAITTVVTIAEILKNNGLAIEKKVITSTVGMKDETRGRLVQKAKIEIVLGKTEKFDSLVTNNTATAAAAATDQPTAATTGMGENKQ
ncbi:Alba domain-containing protein [Heracleum sosnowskyi]|uniref:Alba domain-containing protein n=1 Tax=Heracleum sosnowskyi TaxID=360622 RepID=A0AAD8MFP9_9APIA|nr:Alba domain-containing protein [Heracleum sosnowskyi]